MTLNEDRIRRDWVDSAGLLVVHIPVIDMDAPTQSQLSQCVSVIERSQAQKMGVLVHCTAGMGRTGTVLAAYFVSHGFTPQAAIARVRELRPGSVETVEQEESVREFARRMADAAKKP